MAHEELDRIAWQTIHENPRPAGKPRGVAYTNRPANFRELADLMRMVVDPELAWSEFLHEFMLYRSVSFFVHPPPELSSSELGTPDFDLQGIPMPVFSAAEFKALCAGMTEVLCDEFGLPVPVWVHDPAYTLPEPWDPYAWMFVGLTDGENRARIAKSDPLFLKHGVIWQRRSLITL